MVRLQHHTVTVSSSGGYVLCYKSLPEARCILVLCYPLAAAANSSCWNAALATRFLADVTLPAVANRWAMVAFDITLASGSSSHVDMGCGPTGQPQMKQTLEASGHVAAPQ